MIKKFNAPCNFNGSVSPFAFWVSDDYKNGNHPLYFQTDWLSKSRGGAIDPKISEGIAQIAKISEENKISFEYLFMIAMDAALKANTAGTDTTVITTANDANAAANDTNTTSEENTNSEDEGYESTSEQNDDSNKT